jgi:hypothetical protein
MQTPLPDTYPVIQKNKSSALPDVFVDILRLKVGSLQWLGPMLPLQFVLILLFHPVAILVLRFTNCHQKVSKRAKKSIMQKWHKRLAKRLFFIPVTHF